MNTQKRKHKQKKENKNNKNTAKILTAAEIFDDGIDYYYNHDYDINNSNNNGYNRSIFSVLYEIKNKTKSFCSPGYFALQET